MFVFNPQTYFERPVEVRSLINLKIPDKYAHLVQKGDVYQTSLKKDKCDLGTMKQIYNALPLPPITYVGNATQSVSLIPICTPTCRSKLVAPFWFDARKMS